MVAAEVSERIFARYQALSVERLDRIALAWVAVTRGGDRGRETEMFRDLHTLKGDSRIVGLAEMSVLCQKLEDLFFAAQVRDYAVHDDLDVLVTTAIQFGQLYVRAKRRERRMDVSGFAKQIDDALADLEARSVRSVAPQRNVVDVSQVPAAIDGSSATLARAATVVYLEQLRAAGEAKERLAGVWRSLVTEVAHREAAPLAPVLARDATAAADLAKALGKEVRVTVDGGRARARIAVVDALHEALVHLVSNAVDHGIEPPDERSASGKPRAGTLRVTAVMNDDGIVVTVSDDGRGIDLERVREVAIARQLLSAEVAQAADEQALIELLFLPGFSTREQVTEVSGRGIGMDAVREGIERVGGTLELETRAGAGSTVVVRVPRAAVAAEVLTFRRGGVRFAVASPWQLSEPEPTAPAFDLFAHVGLASMAPPDAAVAPFTVCAFGRAVRIAADEAPTRARATRPCPTPDAEPAEIVDVGGEPVVLVRP